MVGATICKKEFFGGRLFALVGCEIAGPHLPTYSGVCSMSYGRLWQHEGGGATYIDEPERHLNLAVEMAHDLVWKPHEEYKFFNENRRGKIRDYSYRTQDGSLYSWVNGLLWIDSALSFWYKYNEHESDSEQWSDEDDFIPFLWWTRVPWVLLCAEFQLGEAFIECEVLLSYDHDYQRFIKSAVELRR